MICITVYYVPHIQLLLIAVKIVSSLATACCLMWQVLFFAFEGEDIEDLVKHMRKIIKPDRV